MTNMHHAMQLDEEFAMFDGTRQRVALLAIGLMALVVAAVVLRPGHPVGPAPAASTDASPARYLQVPLGFEANLGQAHGDVRFLSRGLGYSLFLTATEAVFSLSPQHAAPAGRATSSRPPPPAVVRMSLVGANADPVMEGQARQAGVSHYLTGRDVAHWQRNVERFGKVRYRQVYPGIDLVYYGNQQQLEYDFVVAPGADPRRIRLNFQGIHALRLDEAGNLVMTTGGGDLTQHKPITYQEIDGRRQPVESRYRLLPNSQVEFALGAYDSTHPLIIDPVLVYSTMVGGSFGESAQGIAVDAAGNMYITGSTGSLDFPVEHALQPDRSPPTNVYFAQDAFVTKISATGDELIYSTYLGGNSDDDAHGIAVDDAGNAVITGYTSSTNFPLSSPWQATTRGSDAFIAKLGPEGDTLIYSSYLGGAGWDTGKAIALDVSGNAYVSGITTSTGFPTTAGVLQPGPGGGSHDAFVAKFDPEGVLAYSTYFGASGNDQATSIAVDEAGNAYIGGTTSSDGLSTPGAFQTGRMGGSDGFIAKVAASGDVVIYSTYLGGSGDYDHQVDHVNDIAIDEAGNAYVTGYTRSSSFPLANPFQSKVANIFVSKLDPSGSALVYSSYLGGGDTPEQEESGNAIAVDREGNAYVAGSTASATFPAKYAFQATNNSPYGDHFLADAFVTKVNAAGNALVYSTYLGGPGVDAASDIAVGITGSVYVAGGASAMPEGTVFPLVNPLEGKNKGGGDVFVSKLASPNWYVVGAGDTNADGRADVLWHNPAAQQMDWWLMDGATRRGVGSKFVPSQYQVAATADFNGDGRSDLLWHDDARTSLWIWQAEADGGFSIEFVDDYPPVGWEVVGAGDVDGDGRADILWHNSALEQLDWWRMAGAARLAVGRHYIPSQYRVAATADFNGDGRTDILWHDDARTSLWVWQAEPGDFSIHFVDNFPSPGWAIVGAGDVNGDRRADVLWHNVALQQLDWWLMAGAERWGVGSKFIPPQYHVEAIGDFNGDHRSDILWRNEDGTTVWIWQAEPADFSIQFVANLPPSN